MSSSRKPILLAVFALLGAGLYFVFNGGVGDIGPTPPNPTPINKADTRAPTDDPSPSFDLVCHTADTGGDERTREQAIAWLDTQAREGQPLTTEQSRWLLHTLEAGGHPDWQPGYRQWFYNSAFNALHRSEAPQPLTRLLAKVTSGDPDPTLRLYALQHIGTQRLNGRLRDSLATEIHSLLQKLLEADPASAATPASRLSPRIPSPCRCRPSMPTAAIPKLASVTVRKISTPRPPRPEGPAEAPASSPASRDTSSPEPEPAGKSPR